MHTLYKTKDAIILMAETEWGKLYRDLANKPEQDLRDDDMIIITAGDKINEAQKARKGDGYWWLSYCHKPIIKIVVFFDTVGSLGYLPNVLKDVAEWNKKYEFHNTDIHPGKKSKTPFTHEHLMSASINDTNPMEPAGECIWEEKQTNLFQCWFPRVHINSGGGSMDGLKKTRKGDLESMLNTTFAWMVHRYRPFLRFEEKMLSFITQQYFEKPRKLTERSIDKSTSGWGVGPYQKECKGIPNMIIGEKVSTPSHYYEKPDTREYIHPVVFHAMDYQKYASKALEGFKRISNGDGQGHLWVKTYTPKDKQSWAEWAGFKSRTVKQTADSVIVTLPKFVIPKMVVQQGSYSPEKYYSSSLERLFILRNQWSDDQAKQAFESKEQYRQRKSSIIEKQGTSGYLMQLDKDNAATKDIGETVSWGTPVLEEPKNLSDPFLSGV